MPAFAKRFPAPGTPPGSLTVHPRARLAEAEIRLIDFGREFLEERRVSDVVELAAYLERSSVTWIDVVGLHDVEQLRSIGEIFGLHPLALEDVLNMGQRPKVQEFDHHLFIVLQDLQLDQRLAAKQISIFLGDGWVITMQDDPGTRFAPVRERLRRGGAKLREGRSDYLAYALVDTVVDQCFPVLEALGDRIDELQDELVERPERELLERVQNLKSDLLTLRHAAWPQREVVDRLVRREFAIVGEETRPYFLDCYDHSVQIVDTVEYYREMAGGMVELYLTAISNRTNEVMKVLTIIASIFIPLTFITGVYGMNFDPTAGLLSMPELGTPWGYPAVWIVMLLVGLGMWIFFRYKRWL